MQMSWLPDGSLNIQYEYLSVEVGSMMTVPPYSAASPMHLNAVIRMVIALLLTSLSMFARPMTKMLMLNAVGIVFDNYETLEYEQYS